MRASVLLVLAALLSGATCVQPRRMVKIAGREVTAEEAARVEFDDAWRLFEAGRWEAAAVALLAVAEKYPETRHGPEALYRAGVAFSRASDYARAAEVLQRFLEKYPTDRFKRQAAVELGLAQARLGRREEAVEVLKPLAEELTGEERREAATVMSQAFEGAGQLGEAVRWAAEEVAAAAPEAQGPAMERLVQLVEKAGFLEVAKLHADIPRTNVAYPTVAMKLGRVRYHLGDFAGAVEALNELVEKDPGGRWTPAARELVARIGRRGDVDPAAIGVILPMSGRFKSYGETILDGIALAVDIHGRGPIRVVIKDSAGDPAEAARAVEELAVNERVIAIIGPVAGSEEPAAALRAEELGVPMISLARTERITEIGPHIFRNCLTNSAQGRALAAYAMGKLALKSFAFLLPDIAYGLELTEAFWDEVERRGGTVTGYEKYEHDETTFPPVVKRLVGRAELLLKERPEYVAEETRIKAEIADPYRQRKALDLLKQKMAPAVDFDALFVPDVHRTVSLVAPALAVEDVITNGCNAEEMERVKKTTKSEPRTVQLLGANGWNDPDLVRRGGKYVECSIFVDGFFVESSRRETRVFVEDFRTAYQRAPGIFEAQAYDTATLVRLILDKQKPKTREELRRALLAVRNFPGVTGDTSFSPEGEALKPLFVLNATRDGIREIDTAPVPEPPPAQARVGP
jgi:ABC-type branched-subunit amino acid transport system substrate-binding protein